MQHRHHTAERITITGGAGFVGHCLADRLLSQGYHVTILDDFSSPWATGNVTWLKDRYSSRVRTLAGDVRDAAARREALSNTSAVFHLAALANGAASMAHPRRAFEVNARATGELIADLLRMASPPDLIFASGREVYGSLGHVDVQVRETRVEPVRPDVRRYGLSEATPANFETPLGCSKLAAEQHVQWAATRGIRAVVLRLGAVYGTQGCGSDDSDFLAQLALATAQGRRSFLRGDGRQVRDWLYVDDAAEALAMAANRIDRLRGGVFHAGGGPENAASELELLDMLGGTGDSRVVCSLPRPAADPDYYVCDNRRFETLSGWRPRTSLASGIQRLRLWAASEISVMAQGAA